MVDPGIMLEFASAFNSCYLSSAVEEINCIMSVKAFDDENKL